MPRLLLTRPQEDSQLLAARLGETGIETLISPIITISPVEEAHFPSALPDGIIITSRHALAHITMPEAWHSLPVYAVGESTAQHAREKGFHHIAAVAENAAALAGILQQATKLSTLLYISGDVIRFDFAGALASFHMHVERLITYYSLPAPVLPQEVADAIKHRTIHGAVFFSHRTASHFHSLCNRAGISPSLEDMDAFCLSADIADALPGWRNAIISQTPDMPGMLDAIKIWQHPLK